MAWSTKQLADLAGTTVKTVRHYHEIGLLELPERTLNGYKQYRVAHLVRLLQIRRLTDLGVSLSQIAAMTGSGSVPEETIRQIDAELAESIDRLQNVRAELAMLLEQKGPVDVPAEFTSVSGALSDADRALIMVYSRVLGSDAMEGMHAMLQERNPIDDEIDGLSPDADDETIEDVARRLAPYLREQEQKHDWITRPGKKSPRGELVALQTIAQAIGELYNPAQLKLLKRANELKDLGTGEVS